MPLVLTAIQPSTELEAVNAMLSAAGEAPITGDLATAAGAMQDVVMAVNILRNTTRAVQAVGWHFNTESEFPVSPLATAVAWTDPADVRNPVASINVFAPPTRGSLVLATWNTSDTLTQAGLDLVIARARVYAPGSPPVAPLVFYDRANNRDGLDASKFSVLRIDTTWYMDFADMPEVARTYITIKAGRKFCQDMIGDSTRAGFQQGDELAAWATLVRQEAPDSTYNLFDSVDTRAIVGNRQPRMFTGWV